MKGEVTRKLVTVQEFPRKTLVFLQEYHAHDPFVGFGFSSNAWASVSCFLSSLPILPQPSRQGLAPTCHLSTLN
jgi:hypothetical protein